ncbi:hypothetical protein QRX50_11280 [Amycolatopsis carbonis]|uniref:Uncharacterized protein n=1 Tax=Amycolatopsis carbonis TaxID=715471 RepID=A0A9Y2IN05_9PSEU|nr:hypothetical protein [Amycolatopsis sp. 2-15]WIX81298.1 hypothetical protein QRX50_11280 [Amycolatopsis sp. 2-15]
MSTSGGAPFFNAPQGTQSARSAPQPERDGTLDGSVGGERFADPLAGLVTAAEAAPADDARPLPTARPVQHDPEAVKRMVEAALREEAARTPQPIQPAEEKPDGVPLGLLPRQRTWPTRAPQLLKRVPRPRPKAKAEVADDDIEAELAERQAKKRSLPNIGMPNLGRPSTSAAGVILAIVLLIVFVVIALYMVSSLVSSVTGLFS